ncbi:MAG: hypothetical protein QG670_966 [Thermoproteota archaeon]|nr:hypothetical protein [Thermoproteota archaeon]
MGAREYLVKMKEEFFPQLIENLKTIADCLETSSGSRGCSTVLENKLSPTLLWQFRIRFPKPYKKLQDLKKKFREYDDKAASLSTDEEKTKMEDELADKRLALRGEAMDLIKEIEPLINLKKLPPKILAWVNRA